MSASKRVLWVLGSLMLATLACTLISGRGEVAEDGGITVVINTPEDSSEVPVNEELSVQITINDPASVVNRQEILVDGVVVAASEAVAPEGAPAFSVILPYTPTQPGTHTLSAMAYGSDDTSSQPASITLIVTGEAEEEEEPQDEEPEAAPTPTVNPTAVPDASGCENNMTFVADVTIPDGTVMEPGETFTKTWRVRNSGTCDWGGYTFVFHSDNQMGGPASVVVPATPAGQTREISVNLTAPATPNTYFSRWTMRSADGDLFGNIIWAKIVVAGGEVEGGPDLVVTGVTTTPAEPEAGEVTQYTVTVKNQGDDDAGESTLFGEFETAGTATVTVPAIDAGATKTVMLSSTTPAKGQFDAVFTADSEDDVAEADEDNNVLSTNFTYVSILHSGTLEVDEGHSIDFDAVTTALGLCNGTTHDFNWQGDSPANRTLQPCNGASIAQMGGSSVGLDECAAATLGSSTIDIDGEVDSWVCAETNAGHLVAFQIDDLGSAIDPLVITYTVYE